MAVLLLAVGLAVITALLMRQKTAKPGAAPASPLAMVGTLAERHGCAAERVTMDDLGAGPDELVSLTVHAPRGFPVARFIVDLEALAHNEGGRLDPLPVTEKGGYGLGRLEGEIGGRRWRVLILGEAPPPPPPRRTAAPRALARLAIVLDDAGNAESDAREVDRLPPAVAVAVLPNATYAAAVARELGRQRREVLVHLPMEALPGAGPGPGADAIVVGLTPVEISRLVELALSVVAGARGINNHMGSRATADRPTMRALMAALQGRGLYFLDSRTIPETVAEEEARDAGLATLRRDVFLDVVDEPGAVRRALDLAVSRARANGAAVAIGHVHPVTIEVLASELPRLAGDIKLLRPSELAATARPAP
ncbi:MAG: divergent polysaccharide deacetylase family protein [Acidobacteriota bacterium]